MLRLILFAITNLSVIAVASVTLSLLGVDRMLAEQGGGFNLTGLLIFSAVFGFVGAFISLAMSKMMAIRGMGVKLIEQPRSTRERWILETVHRQAERAGIGKPDVGIFESSQPNAFATGMRRNNALVAVSTGLLDRMDTGEVEAVLGHEVSHIANGDMVTMGLLQGVLNTFVIFLARIIGMVVDRVIFRNERGFGIGYFVTYFIAQMILSVLASMVAAWFSRRREFRADVGGAELSSRSNMIGALQALQRTQNQPELPGQLAAFGIAGGIKGGLANLLASHPPLDQRIAALQQQA